VAVPGGWGVIASIQIFAAVHWVEYRELIAWIVELAVWQLIERVGGVINQVDATRATYRIVHLKTK